MTMLEQIEKFSVFSISKTDKGFEIIENCDYYYKAILTKDELIQLGKELIEFAEKS